MSDLEGRIRALEWRILAADVKPGLVQFIDAEGPTPAQAAAAEAIKSSQQVIEIHHVDGRRQPEARSGVDEGVQG